MIKVIFEALYFMLPVYVANTAPLIVKRLNIFNVPIDSGVMLGRSRLFGSHKTWRGIFAGVVFGAITCIVQKLLLPWLGTITLLPLGIYSLSAALAVGAAAGLGALLGDLFKSFCKRRIGIAEGRPWIPFDQLDLIIGGLIAFAPWYTPSQAHLIVIFVLSPLLHFSTNLAAYHLGIKKVWW